jgi:hypothetical protein
LLETNLKSSCAVGCVEKLRRDQRFTGLGAMGRDVVGYLTQARHDQLMHRSNLYSITSSALASSIGGTVTLSPHPSPLAFRCRQ